MPEEPEGKPPTVTPMRVVIALCLIAPFVAMLWVSSYAKVDPAFIGIPFFYWYQMLWVLISTALTMIAYKLWQRDQRARKGCVSMKDGVNGVALGVFIFFFLAVTVVGFMAARWRKAENEASLDEWGLGGRSFGTWVTWFLLGGDLYTAYTFVAVPAAIYAAGAAGFFAVPYTILVYPLIFTFLPRLWSVSHKHGYVTTSDFVRGRFGSKGLSLAVAVTGILATMPYIALQLVGIQAVLDVMGVGGGENTHWFIKDLPLLIAFAVLAAYTYSSGLRAPALIAFVKDGLIYLVIAVAIIYIPIKLGGFDDIFAAAQEKFAGPPGGKPTGALAPAAAGQWGYATLALGSALALFMYPHSITATLSSRSREVIRRNTTILPLYSLMLGLLALLGFMAIAMRRQGGQRPAGDPAAVREHVPRLVRGRGVRRHRYRRTGARRDHVDRRGEPVHPQHLQGLPQARRDPRAGDQGLQAGVAAGEGRRARLRPHHGQDGRDQLPAARRNLDPPDDAGPGRRAVHPMVPPLGAARGLGGRHDLRNGRRLRGRQPDPEALRRVLQGDPGPRRDRLHRSDGLRAEPRGDRRPHLRPERREGGKPGSTRPLRATTPRTRATRV